jgi:hypothetical protein
MLRFERMEDRSVPAVIGLDTPLNAFGYPGYNLDSDGGIYQQVMLRPNGYGPGLDIIAEVGTGIGCRAGFLKVEIAERKPEGEAFRVLDYQFSQPVAMDIALTVLAQNRIAEVGVNDAGFLPIAVSRAISSPDNPANQLPPNPNSPDGQW